MRNLLRWVSALLACVALVAHADDAGPAQKEYVPKGGTGRVVVVISGQTGASNYTSISRETPTSRPCSCCTSTKGRTTGST